MLEPRYVPSILLGSDKLFAFSTFLSVAAHHVSEHSTRTWSDFSTSLTVFGLSMANPISPSIRMIHALYAFGWFPT